MRQCIQIERSQTKNKHLQAMRAIERAIRLANHKSFIGDKETADKLYDIAYFLQVKYQRGYVPPRRVVDSTSE